MQRVIVGWIIQVIDGEFSVNKACSKICSDALRSKNSKATTQSKAFREAHSKLVKLSYANGDQSVGGGRCKWYTYKNIRVQGTYELRTCFILDVMKNNSEILDWEYTNDRYEYKDKDGHSHTYILDFKIWVDNDNFYYIETKGYEKDIDKLKWDAVRMLGYKLEVWFECDIKNHEGRLFNGSHSVMGNTTDCDSVIVGS